MKSYSILLALMSLVFLACFGVVEALDLPLLQDPGEFFSRSGSWGAALLGVGLLVADVLLPVPSSLVMILHGALFGVLAGTLLSLAGSLGAAAFGFALGRWGSVRLHRWVPESERRRADALLGRWGHLAVVVTRPVPILAESAAILAGTSPLGWGRFLLSSLAGNLPACLLYAITGATAARLDSVPLSFGIVLLVAGLIWLAGKRFAPKPPEEESGTGPQPANEQDLR